MLAKCLPSTTPGAELFLTTIINVQFAFDSILFSSSTSLVCIKQLSCVLALDHILKGTKEACQEGASHGLALCPVGSHYENEQEIQKVPLVL